MMRRAIVAFVIAAALSCTISAQADPKPLVVLWESGGWGTPIGPEPYGLRLVVYDDGRVLSSPDTIEMTDDGAPRFLISTINPAAAISMAASIRDDLAAIPKELRGAEPLTDMGWTTIQIWNSENGRFERHDAYGHPCLAPQEGIRSDVFDSDQRASIDAQFLKVCDDLSLYAAAGSKPWLPGTMWISILRQSEKPDVTFEWPGD
jgi:hypothetical protein